MSFKYKNITNTTQILAIVSEDKTSVSHVSLEPGATLEVNVNLDIFVPHILAKLDAEDVNISHLVIKARQELKAFAEKVEEKVEAVVEKVEAVTEVIAEKAEEVVEKVEEEVQEAVEKVETVVKTVKRARNKKN